MADSITLTRKPSQDSARSYVVYKARFVGLLAIVLLNIATGFVWLTYSSVPDAAKEYLHSDAGIINVTSILYFVAYLIMSPVSGWMFEKHGIKKSLLFGGAVQIIGAFIRYMGNFVESTPTSSGARLALTLVGQIIASSAQPFFLNVPPKYAAVWFSDSGRITATMIGSVANALAAALAQLIIPAITVDAASMSTSVLVCLILAVVAIIPVFFMAERPPTPPSPSAEEALSATAEVPFWVSLKQVASNKQFLILLTTFGSFVGFFNAFSSLIVQFTAPYGYSSSEGGYFGAAMIVAGLVGAGVTGPVIDRTKQFKTVLKTMVPAATIFYILFNFAVRKDFFIGIIVVSALLGAFSFSLLPVILELAVECTYPVTPISSTSLLWAAGQLYAVVFLLVLGALQNDKVAAEKGINAPLIFIAAWCVLSCIPIFFYKSSYHRVEAEARLRANAQHGEAYKQEIIGMEDVSLEEDKDTKDVQDFQQSNDIKV